MVNGVINSTNEEIYINYFDIYPNPTSGHLIIDLNKIYGDVNVTVYSILGQQVRSDNYKRTEGINYELKQLPGIYLITSVRRN